MIERYKNEYNLFVQKENKKSLLEHQKHTQDLDLGVPKDFSLGNKFDNQLVEHYDRTRRLRHALKHGDGYTIESMRQGKWGFDKYLIMFGLFGVFMVPFYIYESQKKFKEEFQRYWGIKPGEDIDFDKIDIDDLSRHKEWMDFQKERERDAATLKRKQEILKLEKELYGSKYRTYTSYKMQDEMNEQ